MRHFHPLRLARTLAVALLLVCFGSASAMASVLVNKAFSPNSVQLGVTSNVTITLSNTSILSVANITSFSDNVATMLGKANIAPANNLANSCGGSASIAGNAVSMTGGAIPIAADSTHPGTCTITFTVVGAAVGNGINSIAAGALVTDQGSNATAASQTLQVQSAVLGVSTGVTTILLTSATATQSYTITNPTAAAITNATFPITVTTSSAAVTVSGGSTGACVGAIAPATASASTVTQTVSGLTIPAGGSCTISFSLNDPTIATGYTATGVLLASAITDDQGISNSAGITNRSQFATGRVTFTKVFAPNIITAPGTSRLTVSMANTQTIPLTNVAFSDSLPANVTLDATPAAAFSSGCISTPPTIAGAGTGTLSVSGATIGAATTLGTATTASTCTVTVTVDASAIASGTLTNTILAAALTDTELVVANGNAAANLSISAGALNASKAFSASSAARNVPITETLTFSNGSATALTAGTFTDNLPQTSTVASPLPMQYFTGFTPTFTGCTGTVTPSAGNTIVTGTGLSIAGNGSCVVRFQVMLTGGVFPSQSDFNVIPTANVSFTDSSAAVIHPTTQLSATLSTAPAFTVRTFTASAAGIANQPLTVSSQVIYSPAASVVDLDTNAVATFVLNSGTTHNVMLAPVPNFLFSGCPAGTSAANVTQIAGGVPVASGGESFSVAFPAAIGATCTVTYNIVNKNSIGGASASYTPGVSTYTSTEQTGTSTTAGNGSVTFYTTSLLINKQFTPISIAAGGTATAQFTLDVANVPALATTQANGVTFVDTLPVNMAFAAAPAVTFGAGCTQGGQPTASAAIAGTSITFSNISLLSTSGAQTDCVITFAVTSNFLGNTTNTIPASGVTSTSGATNTQTASASLTVVAGVALQKTFLTPAFAIGDVNYVRFLILNSSGGVLSSGTLTDTMPAALALSSLTAQPAAQGGDPVSCGGIVSGTLGSNVFSLAGMSVAGATGPSTPGQCVQYVQVKASTTAAPGNVVNTIPAGALTIGGQTNLTGTSTPPESVTGAPNATVTQAFAPVSIVQHGVSQLTITFANTSALAAPLSGMALSDALPAGVVVAAVPGAATTCTGGTASATAGGTSVALAGGTLAAGASCTLVVNVTSAVAASYTNTIAAGALTTTQGATNTLTSAVLTVTSAPNVTLGLTFAPASIAPGATSVLTITVANTAVGSLALSNLTLSDVLPSGVTIAALPNASTTCGAGTVTAVAAGTTVALAAGTLGAGLTCSVSVSVTGTTPAVYANTIPIANVTSFEGASNAALATGSLTIVAPNVTLTKAFSPASVVQGSTSLLTVTIANTAPSSVALSGVAFSDSYPAGVVNAAVPGGATTCGAGTVTAVAGAASVALAGGSVAANSTCVVTVTVTAPIGAYTNTLSTLTSAQGATNAAAASAGLTVVAVSPVSVSKAFVPVSIVSGQTSVLTVTLANTGGSAVALTNAALVDTLPAGMIDAAVPAAGTTCASGSVTAIGGGSSVALAGAALAAGATCTFFASVTSSTPGLLTNSIAPGALTNTQGVGGASTATATLTVTPATTLSISKAFAPASVVAGSSAVLTVTIANAAPGAIALTGLAFTDTYPAGLVNAVAPGGATTCGAGLVAAAGGGGSVALSNGSVAAGASCTVSVTVRAPVGTYANSIATLSSAQGLSNATPATASFAVMGTSPVTIAKSFAPVAIAPGQASVLTVSLANTGGAAIALTNVALADALPAGMTVAAVPAASTTCVSGSVSAVAGGTSVSLAAATLAPGATCTFSTSVTSSVPGVLTNTIAPAAFTNTQAVASAGTATAALTVNAATTLTLGLAFAPGSIVSGGTSVLTTTVSNTAAGAIALTALALNSALPAGVVVAGVPNASTTCGAGVVSAGAGAVALTGGALAAGASCTISVTVTGATPGSFVAQANAGAVTDAQSVSNPLAASASLVVTAAPALALAQSFAAATIAAGTTSVLTLSLTNAAAGAVALSGVGFTDTLPAGVVLAAVPNAVTTCAGGAVTATASAVTFTLSSATLPANATCTVSVTVVAAAAGTYTNAIGASAVASGQGASNAVATTAVLTVVVPTLVVTKVADVAGADVSAGQPILYTVAIHNTSAIVQTNAKLTDVMANAALVPGSVMVNGVAAADAIVSGGVPFGSILPDATTTIVYSASVSATVVNGAVITNTVTVGGDQGCTGSPCTASALPDTVRPPSVAVTLLIDGVTSETVLLGQIVTYSAMVKNIGGSVAQNVTFTDVLPAGVTPIPGSVTTPAVTQDSARRGASSTSAVSGQTVTASLGSIAPGASAPVVFRATITAPIPGVAANTVTVDATGIASFVSSNTVVAQMIRALLNVTKTSSATVVRVGDRVNYTVTVGAPGGVAFGRTTIVDLLPSYMLYAPGTARIDGVLAAPVVTGRTLVWTLPSLGAPVTLSYATSIGVGAPPQTTLSNLVTANAVSASAGPPASGSGRASVIVVGSTFGSCYPITGRVYDDVKKSGHFELGDLGLGAVRVVLDDGESVLTDAYGRYNFPCVRPGMHALRIDEQSLPAGSVAYSDRALDSERSTRRLVHSTFDATILQDVNFAIGRP